MSYATQSQLAQDNDFINRCNAAASKETMPAEEPNPLAWVSQNIWQLAASPGFDEAYASALAGGIGRPGWQDNVITDAMILSAVQALLT